ncbi:MAG TPA: hypothetical protein VFA06_15240 [Actinocrinis sp.]|jgi:hypothetical protein|uniref:hypothetical protein n=1 Tax=Actinocrinis sp. TaxID=1920516 RepID=UPI002D379D8B|nr:hypothetical protein [Actinocrinis sp.]HZU57225.1 hypothetical protein [Actinocrinis sp.]
MTEQQFTDEYEAPEADAAEQSLPVVEDAEEMGQERAPAHPEPEVPMEADPADAAEQAVPVPVDEDEYR